MELNQRNSKNEQEESNDVANGGTSNNSDAISPAIVPGEKNQLLDERAEKYLREVANIEGLPDAPEHEEMNDGLTKEK